MQKLIIEGPTKLEGEIKIAGSKNSVLPMMAACLLSKKEVIIHNVPNISDVETMADILRVFGVRVESTHSTMILNAENASPKVVPKSLTEKLRASLLVMGPALSRFGEVEIGFPGGDKIGSRPMDAHIEGLEMMGAKDKSTDDTVKLTGQLKPARVIVHELSVTATEVLLMAAVLTEGQTELRMAACEPQIVGLCDFLNGLGAKISGVGSNFLTIEGVSELQGGEGKVTPDNIEAGTMAIAAAATKGDMLIDDFVINDHDALLNTFSRMKVNFQILGPKQIRIFSNSKYQATQIKTRVYPGFPTDLQAPMAVLFTQAHGTSEIFETIYEGRLQYLFELQRMGARVNIRDSHVGLIEGPTNLRGTELISFDIRAGATILLAALVAHGKTTIDRIEHIDRGYEHLDGRLRALGANIERVNS